MYTHPSSQCRAQPQLGSGVAYKVPYALHLPVMYKRSFPVSFTWLPSWELGGCAREEQWRELSRRTRCTGGCRVGPLSALREVSHTPSVLMEIVEGWDGGVWKL